jgi:hypothetical protein
MTNFESLFRFICDLLKVSNILQKHCIDELAHHYETCPHSIMYFTQQPPNIEWGGPFPLNVK